MANCYQCKYRSRITLTCDYILYENRKRGCSVENCDKFVQREDEPITPYLLEINKLYYNGYSDRAIAKSLNISRYFVRSWRISNGLEPNEWKTKNRLDAAEHRSGLR